MFRPVLVVLGLSLLGPHLAHAQMMMLSQQQLSFPRSTDCPIEEPFTPKPERIDMTADGTTIVFPMNGHLIRRFEIKGIEAPTDVEITWTPNEDRERWGTRSAQLSVKSNDQCHFNWFFAPANVPTKQIEIRSREQISGISISFSDKTWDHEGACSARMLCPALIRNGIQCEKRRRSYACDTFLDLFKKLSETEQCRRSGDFSPVAGIWVCDEVLRRDDSFDGSINVLKRLKRQKNKEAISFYRSREFKRTLDGVYLKDYLDGQDDPKPAPSFYTSPAPKKTTR